MSNLPDETAKRVADRSAGFPEWDIWSLHVMDQGSCQIGRVLGTSPPLSQIGKMGNLKTLQIFQNVQMTISAIYTHPKFEFSEIKTTTTKNITALPFGGLLVLISSNGLPRVC